MDKIVLFFKNDIKKFMTINRFVHISVVIDGIVDVEKSNYNDGALIVDSTEMIKKRNLKPKIISGIELGTYIIKNGYISHSESEECLAKEIRTLIIRTDEEALNKGIQATIELQK